MNNLAKSLLIPITTVLFIFLCLFAFIKASGPLPFTINSINTTKDTLFSVEGKGEITAIPDTAMLSLGVTKTASTVQSAQDQVNIIINQLTTNFKALGIEDKNIKNTNYSVNPQYDYTSGNQKLTGYTVNANLEIKITPIDKANQAIDIATKDGANELGGIQFVVADDKQKELQNEARQQAIQNAKEKADLLSQESGLHLGRLVDVQETPQYNPMPYGGLQMSTLKAADNSTPPTQLNPGENKITTTITLSYEAY